MSVPVVYLDHLATTPLAVEAGDAMTPWLGDRFGNASSATHAYGWDALEAVEAGRLAVAGILGVARSSEICFTSGATESNNFAIRGLVDGMGGKPHVVTSAIEHGSVLECCRQLAARGRIELTTVAPDSDGVVSADSVASAITDETRLVSVMAANNETGAVQPTAEIVTVARDRGVRVHVDAAQAAGKIDIPRGAFGADLVSVSAHKLNGPQGIGALWISSDVAHEVFPQIVGGGQERGMRSGTLPVASIVGFGAAAGAAARRRPVESARLEGLMDKLLTTLQQNFAGVRLNGPRAGRLPGTLNVSFDGVLASSIIANAPELALSSGSACTSAKGRASHVLTAMGLPDERIRSAIRLGLGLTSSEADVSYATDILVRTVRLLGGH